MIDNTARAQQSAEGAESSAAGAGPPPGAEPPPPPPPPPAQEKTEAATPAWIRRASERPKIRAARARLMYLVNAIQDNDDKRIEEAVLRLSRRRKVFAPLAFMVGAFALLFDGLRLLISNWRLTLVQALPAMWIWLAMFDLKAHVLHGKSFHVVSGWVLIPVWILIVGLTVASFYLNAVFAFAIAGGPKPKIRPGVLEARDHLGAIVLSGGVVGLMLAFSTTVVTRWKHPWFTLCLGIVVGVMMVCYVAVPARLIGVKPNTSRRDKLFTSAVGGILGATICAPPYLLGRIGILMLGSSILFIPGIFLIAIGVTLQAGATGAVRAIKLSTKLRDTRREAQAPA
jgi:hypothetical protein